MFYHIIAYRYFQLTDVLKRKNAVRRYTNRKTLYAGKRLKAADVILLKLDVRSWQ